MYDLRPLTVLRPPSPTPACVTMDSLRMLQSTARQCPISSALNTIQTASTAATETRPANRRAYKITPAEL